ncbi:hypothetical protein BESB_048250 [Besnoitia besnoiti]|uniref:C-CAP/cofactor C-like domain-containing protein n=1 Tax=Besnoitia besnoiti TaxID=94643 RepID=A0A2A9MLP4_BESBE|nr:hypothetical protein BESB_048250 [Besnoitia besnoiti]PFH36633.1 hypothetical protein BESB_048250 [Besnoitia besnoiti]
MEQAPSFEEEVVSEQKQSPLEENERAREELRAFESFLDQVLHEARTFLPRAPGGSGSRADPNSLGCSSSAPSSSSTCASSATAFTRTREEEALLHLERLREASEKLAMIRRRNCSGSDGEERRRKLQAATISRMEEQLIQERDRLAAPKKTFSFRKKASDKPSRASSALAAAGHDKREKDLEGKPDASCAVSCEREEGEEETLGPHVILIEKRQQETIIFGPGELGGRELLLRDLDQCLVVVSEKIPAARVRRLSSCLVFFSEIASSLWLFGCTKSLFALKTQQLRVHDSSDTAFLLDIFSSPIIERTRGAVFGPQLLELRVASPRGNSATEASGGESDAEENLLWRDVKDFDWIKKQASPHWEALPLCPPFGFFRAPLALHGASSETASRLVLERDAPEWFSVGALRAAASASDLAKRAAREAVARAAESVPAHAEQDEDEI